ncbi:Uncharacterized protein dnm_073350 [Desulfonema magnum]|uniref:Uncharacterized protein n=1 Tax=Desulfonema magnum TaxID=45655 RepID=A0A975GRP5_9BACT|nr:Uncharacterized protein dnm_073350 [Desulfonema magnum]
MQKAELCLWGLGIIFVGAWNNYEREESASLKNRIGDFRKDKQNSGVQRDKT